MTGSKQPASVADTRRHASILAAGLIAALLMVPVGAGAQAIFQSGDGKASFFLDTAGAVLSLNFGDKSVELNALDAQTGRWWLWGMRVKAVASNGIASLYDGGKDGVIFTDGEIGAHVGTFWQTSSTRQFGLIDLRTFLDVVHVRSSHSLSSDPSAAALTRVDSASNGMRVTLAANSFMGEVGPFDLSLGLSTAYGRHSNYRFLAKQAFCEELGEQVGPDGTVAIRQCTDARPVTNYQSRNAWIGAADLVIWQPWLDELLHFNAAIDVFLRYDELHPTAEWSPGVGVFVARSLKPQIPLGGVTFQWYDSDLRVGLQTGIAF